MNFWETGFTPSEHNTHLKEVYEIPDYVTSVENAFCVKRGVFSWSVTNLSDFPDAAKSSGREVFCHSPLFHLLDTDWCLQLCPKANVNGRRGVSLGLMRDSRDPGPQKVLASYRLGLGPHTDPGTDWSSTNSSVWFEARESIFWKSDSVQLNTSVLGYLEDSSGDGASVICEIYVSYFPTKGHDEARHVSEIDECLPVDMSALLMNHASKNVLIEVRGHQVWAHKSVLSARSKTLDSRLKDGNNVRGSVVYMGSPVRLQLSCSLPCLKCVLAYMYTGSFDYLARNAYFSVGLYEIANELSLSPLRDLFRPDRNSGLSRILVHSTDAVYQARFIARRFLSSNTVYKMQGRLDRNTGLRTSILVYKIGHLPKYFVGFKLEIQGLGGGCFHADISLSVLNNARRAVTARLLSQEFDGKNKLMAIFVLTAAEFASCDTVRLNSIAVRVVLRVHRMEHDPIQSSSPLELEPWSWRDRLSRDLKTLLRHGYASDASVLVGGRSFSVHRPLLAARSTRFDALFGLDAASSGVYRMDDIRPRTFWLMLNYAYCGTLSHFRDLGPGDLVELHMAAQQYGMFSLLKVCNLLLKILKVKKDLVL